LKINERENRLARQLAPAIGYELRRAKEQAARFANCLDKMTQKNTWRSLAIYLVTDRFNNYASLEKFFDKLEIYGEVDGARISNAVASILNLHNASAELVDRVNRLNQDGLNSLIVIEEREYFTRLASEARRVVQLVKDLEPLLEKYGGGITSWEVPT
jgi:hypothetical protein